MTLNEKLAQHNIEFWSATYEVVGLTPLLMSSPLGMLTADQGPSRKQVPKPEDEAEGRSYRLPSGILYAPFPWFREALIGACKGLYTKSPRMSLGGVFASALLPGDDVCALYHPETRVPMKDYEIDRRTVCLKSGTERVRVVRARPRLDEWACKVTLYVFRDSPLQPGDLDAGLIRAGRGGVGENRPSKSGGTNGIFTAKRVE